MTRIAARLPGTRETGYDARMRCRRLDLAIVLALTGPSAIAQTDWNPLAVGSPGPIFATATLSPNAIAFDPLREVVVALLPDVTSTWEWNGTAWSSSPTGGGYHVPQDASLAFDGPTARVMLFGGGGLFTPANETRHWEPASANWVVTSSLNSPSARSSHGMVYDSMRGRVLVFGGIDGTSAPLDDLWAWDGADWTDITPTSGPAARYDHGMAYDHHRDRLVLFGGAASFGIFGDTWEWDGTAWHQLASGGGPLFSSRNAMVYDAARRRTVLLSLSGLGISTWEWDGSEWTERTTSPPPGSPFSPPLVAYDAARRETIALEGPVFAGTTTWSYAPTDPADAEIVPAGCGGPTTDLGDSFPWLGDDWTVSFSNLPDPALGGAFGLLGDPFPDPVDLAVLGAPGCALGVQPFAPAVPLAVLGSAASWSLGLPNDTGLIGLQVAQQLAAFDPAATALGLVFSDAIRITFGGL